MEVECNWLSVEVKRGAKVLQPATVVAVTQESFGSLLGRVFEQYHNDTVTCGFYNDIHSIFIMIFIVYL